MSIRQIRLNSLLGREDKFPKKWEDLTPVQFIQVISIISEYQLGKMAIKELQLRLYLELANINDRKILKKDYSWLEKNILQNLSKMSFVYKIVYKDDRFELLSPAMKKKLEKVMPEDVNESEAIIARRFSRSVEFDLCFKKQLIPCLYSRFKKYEGYTFDLASGVLKTSLSAKQYIDAINVLGEYVRTKDATYLDIMVSILYMRVYNSTLAVDRLVKISKINELAKIAVMINFQAIISYLTTATKYKYLFLPANTKKDTKNLIGMSSILYGLVEKGYGDIEQVGNIDLISFLDLMLKNLIDSAQQMKANNMKPEVIASTLNITIETLNNIM